MREEDEKAVGKPDLFVTRPGDPAKVDPVGNTDDRLWSDAEMTDLAALKDAADDAPVAGDPASSTDTDLEWLQEDPLEDLTGEPRSPRPSAKRGGLVRRALAKLGRKPKPGPASPGDPAAPAVPREKTAVEKDVQAESRAPFSTRIGLKAKVDVASGNPPIAVVLGFIPDTSRKDAIQHAKGYAEDHLDAIENAWVALSGFRGGFIFELHEGGDGKAYLPEIVEALTTDPDMIVWLPSGTKLNRVLTVEMVNGFPYPTILTEEESAAVRASGQVSLHRRGKMERLVKKGERMLIAGMTLAAVSTTALLGSIWYGIGVNQQPVPFRTYNADILPHGQIISLSEALRIDRWVSSITFVEGQWRAEFEEVSLLTLPDDTAEAQQMSDELISIEAGIRDRLSGNASAEIPELTPRDVVEPSPAGDGDASAAPLVSVDASAEDVDMYLAEIETSPEAFIARLVDPAFRKSVIDTPRLRLAGFRNETIRAALLENQTPSQEED